MKAIATRACLPAWCWLLLLAAAAPSSLGGIISAADSVAAAAPATVAETSSSSSSREQQQQQPQQQEEQQKEQQQPRQQRRHLRTDVLLDSLGNARTFAKNGNATNPFRIFSEDELERERRERKQRMRERREKAREWLQNRPGGLPPPAGADLQKLTADQVRKLEKDRKLSWWSSSSSGSNSASHLADPSEDYDMWAQAYRMLGGMIDCDHDKDSSGSGNSGDDDNGDSGSACSRWMVWAAYVNPDYEGNEYDEYFGDEPTGSLDCHNPDSNWELMGVYRQEFYQFIEQISKHLWAIDDYEYVVALAGLAYMTDADCFQVGSSNSGDTVYAGVAPQPYGYWEMALYTDEYCLTPDTSLGMTYDDFGMGSSINLGSEDETDDDSYSWAYDWWYDSQEYTFTNLNEVYEEYKYCTSCVDYPTYQDGYFIGDDGTDGDDLINQCWKFYSHDSFVCEADCIAKAHAQGTILSVEYGDTTFGKTISGFYQERDSTGSVSATESPFQRLMANAALTASFLLFVATFLAFAVARRSRYRESKSSRSRRLLDDHDDGDGRSRRSRRSSKNADGDGLFRAPHSSSRAKSMSRKHGSTSARKSRSGSKGGDRSSRSKSKRSRSYEPPNKEDSKSRSKSASVRPDEGWVS